MQSSVGRRDELLLSVPRIALLVAAALLPFGASDAKRVAVVLVIVGALGAIAIAVASVSVSEPRLRALSVAAFAFDASVAVAIAWAWTRGASGDPLASVSAGAVLAVVPIEAAVRFSRTAAVSTAVAVSLLAFLDASRTDAYGAAAGFSAVAIASAYALASNFEMRRRSSIAVEEHAARLVELDRMKDRYIALTSHEIRGPLSSMISAVDTIRTHWDKITEERRSHILEMVSAQGRHLFRLVEDLLTGTQAHEGRITIKHEWVELAPEIERALEMASPQREGHVLEVFVEPLRCELDALRVGQIVRNLVENAYKYTPPTARVSVSAKSEGDGIVIDVFDDGPGIPEEARARLFEPFFRVQEETSKEGVGLGLYVVHRLVEAMGGRIDLTSSTRGTRFSIQIPCAWERIDRPRMDLLSRDEGASRAEP